jgi:hypothetical protein
MRSGMGFWVAWRDRRSRDIVFDWRSMEIDHVAGVAVHGGGASLIVAYMAASTAGMGFRVWWCFGFMVQHITDSAAWQEGIWPIVNSLRSTISNLLLASHRWWGVVDHLGVADFIGMYGRATFGRTASTRCQWTAGGWWSTASRAATTTACGR